MQSERVFDDPVLADVPFVGGYPLLAPCLIFDLIGRGGMGTVFLARHLRLDIDVAVKCMRPELAGRSDSWVLRFRREASLAAQTSHQNLVRSYDVLQWRDLHYIVMEVVHGENGRQRVERVGPLPVEEALAIVAQVAAGLALAHDAGIVHRDVKPENMLISTDGHVKLADLGLAKALESGSADLATTLHTSTMGTPQYMAPEQWEDTSGVGPAADVYSLGASLFFFLSGMEPRPRVSLHEFMQRAIREPLPDIRTVRDDVPEKVAELVRRATALVPTARPVNARRFLDELRCIGSGDPTAAGVLVGHASWTPHRLRPTLSVLNAAGEAMLVGRGVGMGEGHGGGSSSPISASRRDPSGEAAAPRLKDGDAQRYLATTPTSVPENRVGQGEVLVERRRLRNRPRLWIALAGAAGLVIAGVFFRQSLNDASSHVDRAEREPSEVRVFMTEVTPLRVRELCAKLARVISVSWEPVPVPQALAELSEQLGESINSWDGQQGDVTSVKFVCFVGSASITDLLDLVCSTAGASWDVGIQGVLLGRDTLPPQSGFYDIAPVLALGNSPDEVLNLVRENIARETWDMSDDYSIDFTFNGNLLVIHSARVHAQIAAFLDRLVHFAPEVEIAALDGEIEMRNRLIGQCDYVDTSFRQIIQDVAEQAQLPWQLYAGERGCFEYAEKPVTVNLRNAPLRTVVTTLAGASGLNVCVESGRLVVAEVQRPSEYLLVMYDIREIEEALESALSASGIQHPPADFRLLPSGTDADAGAIEGEPVVFGGADQVATLIVDNVKANVWTTDPNTTMQCMAGMMIVRAPLPIHVQVRGVLDAWRQISQR